MAFELDKHIASLLAKKDSKAITLLYENYSNSLFGVIKSIIDNDKIAEPVFSMRAFRKETQFIETIATYLSEANIFTENYQYHTLNYNKILDIIYKTTLNMVQTWIASAELLFICQSKILGLSYHINFTVDKNLQIT